MKIQTLGDLIDKLNEIKESHPLAEKAGLDITLNVYGSITYCADVEEIKIIKDFNSVEIIISKHLKDA